MICTAAGVVFSLALKQRCKQLRMMLSLIGEVSSEIRYSAVPLPELMRELSEKCSYRDLAFLGKVCEGTEHGMTVQDAWTRAVETASFLNENDREILYDVGGRLGESDTDGQLLMLSQAEEMLSRSLTEAEADCSRRAGAILRVWTLCGIGAGMVII